MEIDFVADVGVLVDFQFVAGVQHANQVGRHRGQGAGALDAADAVGFGVFLKGAGDRIFLVGAVAAHHIADHNGRGDDAAVAGAFGKFLIPIARVGVHHRLGEAAQIFRVHIAPRFDHFAGYADHRADFRG